MKKSQVRPPNPQRPTESRDPRVVVLSSEKNWSSLPGLIQGEFPGDGLQAMLDGRNTRTIEDFYAGVGRAVPLIRGFGCNLDALVDLFRTFGWGSYAGQTHVFVWYRPEVMLECSPREFRNVLDIVVGVSKELFVGDEKNPEFDASDVDDWIPTRLNVVFVCRGEAGAGRIAKVARRLSVSWDSSFHSLDIPVEY